MAKTYFYCSYTGSEVGFQFVSDEASPDRGDGTFEPMEKKEPDGEWRFIDGLMIQSLFDFAYGRVPGGDGFFVLVKRLEHDSGGEGFASKVYMNFAFVFPHDEFDAFRGFVSYLDERLLEKKDAGILAGEASGFVVPDRKADFCGIRVNSKGLREFLGRRGESEIHELSEDSPMFMMRRAIPDKSDHSVEIGRMLASVSSAYGGMSVARTEGGVYVLSKRKSRQVPSGRKAPAVWIVLALLLLAALAALLFFVGR